MSFMPFPKGVSPKINAVARLKFELAYYDVALQKVSNYATGNSLYKFRKILT